MSLEQEIRDKALALGLDAAGITDAAPIGPEHVAHFEAWLRSGYAGRMDYLHRHLEKRIHPANLLAGAKSVIIVALNYKLPAPATTSSAGTVEPVGTAHPAGRCESPAPATAVGWAPPTIFPETLKSAGMAQPTGREPAGKVAQYAQYEDYHPFIKSLLGTLADFIRGRTDGVQRFKICVDSAPLAEKALAARAGLGFLGKNHLLMHPRLGPQILLGEIVTTMALRPDGPIGDSCGDCCRCLQACPTGALRPDGFLDASRCISYLTQYGAPDESAGRTGEWLFGCDECLLACPFHRNAPARANPQFRWYPERAAVNPRELLELTSEEFEARFHDSPIRRLGLERLKHNARLCLTSRARRE